MDDRRRTISSEEQMIGEALMRVSNTLEAQRLTKSLDYQEKLRRRSNIRLIIAVMCMMVAFMMVMVGGALLFVLWRYADPVLDVVMPFLQGMFGDFGIIWDGLVESATYMPVMVEQLTRMLESMCIMLEGISSMDIAGLMRHVSTIMGTMTGMIVSLGGAMDTMIPMLGVMGDALTGMIQGIASGDLAAIGDFLKGMGLEGMGEAIFSLMQSLVKFIDGAAGSFENVNWEEFTDATAAMINGTSAALETIGKALEAAGTAIDPEQAAAMVSSFGEVMSNLIDGLGAIADLMAKLGSIEIPSIGGGILG